MESNIKVNIDETGKKLIAKFTPEDMALVQKSQFNLHTLAKATYFSHWDICKLQSDGIVWTADVFGYWTVADAQEIEEFLNKMVNDGMLLPMRKSEWGILNLSGA